MLFIEPPNIFRGAPNDYNIRVMKCKKSPFPEEDINYLKSISSIIQKEQGYYPLVNTKNRNRELVEARQLLATMLIRESDWTQAKIGSMLGSKDHSTIFHSVKAVNNRLDTEREFRELYSRIETRVKMLIK